MAQVDFYNMLSGLGDTIAKQRKESARKQAFADINNPDGTVDFQKAIMGLTQAGDVEGAARISQMANAAEDRKFRQSTDARDFGFRQQEAARAQKNADRSYGLQAQTAGKGTIQKIKGVDGSESLVRIMPDGTSVPVNTGSGTARAGNAGGAEPNNPFAPAGKQTEGQANASLYVGRMFNSEKILRDPKSVSAATSTVQRAIDRAPVVGSSGMTGLGNYVQGEDYQKFDQAQRDFINATLRRESGAVISDAEFDNARKQYFPRPGDSKEVIEQKKRNRMYAIKGIAGAAGPAYRAPFTFDDAGELQPRGQPQKAQAADAAFPPPPKVGESRGGYRFKGGNPGDPSNWSKLQ